MSVPASSADAHWCAQAHAAMAANSGSLLTPRALDELIPSALHTVERYAHNPVEADHGRLQARLRLMRGLKRPPVRADPGRRARLRGRAEAAALAARSAS